jgi:hypothetical protein
MQLDFLWSLLFTMAACIVRRSVYGGNDRPQHFDDFALDRTGCVSRPARSQSSDFVGARGLASRRHGPIAVAVHPSIWRSLMRTLPDADDLFLRFFDPWYDDANRKRRGFKATFPDMIQNESLAGLSRAEATWLPEEAQQDVMGMIDGMFEAACGDWPGYLSVTGDISLDWIDAFDRYYDRDRIHDLIQRSESSDFGNDYLVICCEFGAALSHVLRDAQPRLVWRLDWPYWDSTLLDPKTGTAISVFHWAVKKLSDYGVDDGYAAKTKACLHFLADERNLS